MQAVEIKSVKRLENSDTVIASDSSCGASCSSSVEDGVEHKCSRAVTSDDSDWLHAFRIPYAKFPKAVLAACERGERPSPPERREIIRIICTAVYEKTSVPLKKHMAVIAQSLIKKYPLSFLDIVNGDVVGNGYSSVTNQLVSRAENVRRCTPPTKRKRTPKSTPTKVVPVGDNYGFLQMLPDVPADVVSMMTASDSSCGASCSSMPDETCVIDSLLSSSLPTDSLDWIGSFEIPYNSFPRTVLTACEKGVRPTPAERREIIRTICSAIFEKTSQPLKKHMSVIAQKLVKRYPQSFQDVLNGDVIGNGYSSVMNQLIARAENVRRSMRNSIKRRMSMLGGTPVTKVPFSDSYACVQFLPELPAGENEVSQLGKKVLLKEEFLAVEWDKQKVNSLMQLTYASQRLTIINRKDISEVKREWPFLTVSEFLLNHFEKLIGFRILDRLDLAMEKKAPELLAFFKSPHNPHFRNFRDVAPDANLFGFVSWLCNYFDENENQLLKVYENSNCIEDVESDKSCPSTPFIATFGDPFDMEPCCLVFVEREVISEFVNIRKALVIWFAAFYIFNLKYPEACSATLEFIQRVFFNINSERGTKMPKRYGKRTNIHPKVLALSNNLSQYKNRQNCLQ